MAITLRTASHSSATTKGSPLTHAELDANFTSLLDSGGSSLLGFIQSGSGALTTRTVQAALRAITRSGDYDTTANFNTGTDALTETIGIHSIQAVAAGLQFKFPTNAFATNGTVMTFVPYEFGTKIGLAGSGQNHDNRLEFYLGSADSDQAELSVRHNGNSTGALIQARNAGDTEGIALSFIDSSYPWVRWGNAGPFLIKDSAGVLVQRNYNTVGEAQQFWIANTFTAGGAREVLQLGYTSNNAVVRTLGVGGGTQRPLILDGATFQIQTGGTARWNVNASGHLLGATDNSFDIGASGATRPRTGYFGTSLLAPFLRTDNAATGAAVADTVQFYGSDNSAGNTIPSFYCEGTEVLATGQADSASSVRVKMRINGTVVTLLAI